MLLSIVSIMVASNQADMPAAVKSAAIVSTGISIAISFIIFRIYRDCADRQDILVKSKLSTKPRELETELEDRLGKSGVIFTEKGPEEGK
jgi:hypothetical protein